jgi:hypothetical protein
MVKVVMTINSPRIQAALKAMGWHFGVSVLVALFVATFVFIFWFPYPYRELAGGRQLFFLVIAVDLVCGPLLTMVLFNPVKPRRELATDLGLVVLLQLAALVYGVWTVYMVRPLYLVHEMDRFKVITRADVDAQELAELPSDLQRGFFSKPMTVGLREASKEEKQKVMLESVQGGRDYGERPVFYAPYDAANAEKAYQKAPPLERFVKKYPSMQTDIDKLLLAAGADVKQIRYVPIPARQDWVALLNHKGEILGYVPGDGF